MKEKGPLLRFSFKERQVLNNIQRKNSLAKVCKIDYRVESLEAGKPTWGSSSGRSINYLFNKDLLKKVLNDTCRY